MYACILEARVQLGGVGSLVPMKVRWVLQDGGKFELSLAFFS